MASMPKRVKFRKSQRGKIKGVAQRGNRVSFGDFGLQALSGGWIKANVIEACRVAAVRGAPEARLYVRGSVGELGADCVEKELRPEHVDELRGLLERAGVDDATPDEFKRYGSARRLYHFNIDHASEY